MSFTKTVLGTVVVSALFALPAAADVTDFGGWADRFKGNGDLEPPECQIGVPTAASQPFFVEWNCSDNFAAPQELRTELWIYRKGSPAGQLLANFLGFPASVQIDAGVLGAADFRSGLPVSFKLVARDRAGVSAISPLFTVTAQDNSVDTCTMTIETEATEATADQTGVPASTVKLDSVPVKVSQSSSATLAIRTLTAAEASPCEIDAVCDDGEEVSFSSTVHLGEQNAATGTISVSPGNMLAAIEGSYEMNDITLTELSLSGQTTVDGAKATVTLNCSND